jgi:hypothetical protein
MELREWFAVDDFTELCRRIVHQAIPAWLSLYQVAREQDLPSPFYGEILFLRQWMKQLDHSIAKQEDASQASSMLLAAVKLFSLKYSSASSEWLHILLDDDQLMLDWDERLGFEQMIQSLFGAVLQEQQDWPYFFKNYDVKFNGQVWLGRALAHYKELMRLVLLRAYMNLSSQPTQIKTESNVQEIQDGFAPWRGYFQTSFMSNEKADGYVEVLTHMTPLGTVSQSNLIRAMLKHHQSLSIHDVYASWMGWGMVYLMLQQNPSCFECPQEMMNLDPLTQWKLSYAAYAFCRLHIFKQGDFNLGLSLVPLFGLSEGEVWWYWQDALNLLEKNMNHLIQHKLQWVDYPLSFWWPQTKEASPLLQAKIPISTIQNN